ncbi:hypothetical protein EYF80_012930 [Liparis tanakae]|uniref:Uncharacterized protein n=1 Tax=Liparis tanakae TaxID=230148 RepID=A0A4Z2IGG4_9TELE|nr:hypothetical protein EYF80_012930 [Liparis tanakae]
METSLGTLMEAVFCAGIGVKDLQDKQFLVDVPGWAPVFSGGRSQFFRRAHRTGRSGAIKKACEAVGMDPSGKSSMATLNPSQSGEGGRT